MKLQSFPCKTCIAYAACRNRLYTECSILYNSLDNAMYPNNNTMKVVAQKNRATAQQYAKALGYDRFVIYTRRVFMFKSLGLTKSEEKAVIAFLERNHLHGVF